MTGGLLQLITSGQQDIYLTVNPQITFFKKIYRRYTIFSTELKDISPEQQANYDSIITFIIDNQGDLLHRCYLEITLPTISFSDSYITNTNYINKKSTDIINLNTNISTWTVMYNNLKGFCDVELILYRTLKSYLNTDNITLTILHSVTIQFNYQNKLTKDLYKNKIDGAIYNKINISAYIDSITALVVSEKSSLDNTITTSQISLVLDNIYEQMTYYLTFYNNKINFYTNKLNLKQTNQINFNYAEYLGHNYFDNITLEIGGQEIQQYPKDYLHISQLHSIKQDYIPNYLEMIGHTPELTSFNTLAKGGRKVLVPLIFWFNKNIGASLPLVALQRSSTIAINVKISNLTNIICFQDFNKMFNDLLNVSVPYDNTIIIDNNLIYSSYNIDIYNKVVNYTCLYINDKLLQYQFPDLTVDERTIILNNGTAYTYNEIQLLINPSYQITNNINNLINKQYIINANQWLIFMNNIKNSNYSTLATKIGSYYPYIDFNLYYSLIQPPIVKLIGEFIYLDDVERGKFANSKLEYIVETFDEDIYNINNDMMFNCELSFIKPCKELYWYIQPSLFINGLSPFGQNTVLLFDSSKYFINSIINSQSLKLNNYEVLQQNVDDNYYTYLLSYKYLNNILVKGIYYNSFSLYPEETQPSGVVNLREIKGKNYSVNINNAFLKEYYNNSPGINPKNNPLILKFMCKSYDLFVVHKSFAKLLFNI